MRDCCCVLRGEGGGVWLRSFFVWLLVICVAAWGVVPWLLRGAVAVEREGEREGEGGRLAAAKSHR